MVGGTKAGRGKMSRRLQLRGFPILHLHLADSGGSWDPVGCTKINLGLNVFFLYVRARGSDGRGGSERRRHFHRAIRASFTFVAGFQFDLSAVAPVAPVGPRPDPEHVGGPRLQPLHRHHVRAGL